MACPFQSMDNTDKNQLEHSSKEEQTTTTGDSSLNPMASSPSSSHFSPIIEQKDDTNKSTLSAHEQDLQSQHDNVTHENMHKSPPFDDGSVYSQRDINVIMADDDKNLPPSNQYPQKTAIGAPPMGMGMLLGNSPDNAEELAESSRRDSGLDETTSLDGDRKTYDYTDDIPYASQANEFSQNKQTAPEETPASPPLFDAQRDRTNTIREKEKILFGLYRLRKKGVNASTRYTIESDLETMRDEFRFLKKRVDMQASRAFAAKMLVMIVTALEFMNDRWDPFDLCLDGWSEHVHENIGDYDEVFDQLYEKYKEKMAVAPEVKLMLMLGGSAFMFHMTASMFRPSATTSTANIPRDTVRNMMDAANREIAHSVPVAHDRPMAAVASNLSTHQNARNIPSFSTKKVAEDQTVASLRQYLDTRSDEQSVTSSISIVTKGGTRRRKKKTVARIRL